MLAKVAGQNRFKVGNGVSTWSKLEYISSIALGNGLAFDKNGQIVVDFSVMPTEKFEQLLKSIWVPIKVTSNKNFYINGSTGSDVLSSGRGESTSLPFKTIQACVNYISDNYQFSRCYVYIYIKSGTYKTSTGLVLPEINIIDGTISIYSVENFENLSGVTGEPVVISIDYNATNSSSPINCKILGKNYYLNNICFSVNIKTINRTNDTLYIENLQCRNAGSAYLYGCKFVMDFSEVNVVQLTKSMYCYIIDIIDNSRISLLPWRKAHEIEMKNWTNITSIASPRIYVFTLTNESRLDLGSSYSSEYTSDFIINAKEVTVFIRCEQSAVHVRNRSDYACPYIKFKFTSTVTGYRFIVLSGGHIITNGLGINYFPGDKAGTIETTSYSYYI